MSQIHAYAAFSPTSGLSPWQYQPRPQRPDDVTLDVLYCGVCHTDIHFAENDWHFTSYPVVPGHEIIGRVISVGPEVSRFQPGDLVGVGCLVDSCRNCSSCSRDLEQYCLEGPVFTYNGIDRHDQSPTYGGYSERLQVSEHFVVSIPDGLDPASAAPILCAGITTYSPLRHVGLKTGDRIGVIGMGGLGHMAIKFARAMGAEVTLFTRSASKADEARRNGVNHIIVSTDTESMKQAMGSLDYIIDTVPVTHDLNPYLQCLKIDGTHILVGQLTPLEPAIDAGALIMGRRSILGSVIGGIAETQEVLDFCARHGITCDTELIRMDQINDAYARMKHGDVRYRFVIDMATLRQG